MDDDFNIATLRLILYAQSPLLPFVADLLYKLCTYI